MRDDAFRRSGDYRVVRGRAIFLVDHGAGSPLLFLHGIPTFSYLWRDVVPVVAATHRAIAPDLLGFGYSDKPRDATYTVAAQADLLQGLLDELDVGQVGVVCHDFGALVAAELLARNPSRIDRLVILNTSFRREQWRSGAALSLLRVPVLGEVALALAREWMLKLAMRIYVSCDSRLTDEVMDHYWWPFAHGFRRTLLWLARHPAAREPDYVRWRASLGRLAVPCLIVWGAWDPTFRLDNARDLAALIPGAELQVFEHANHFVPEDRPLALARLIAAFTGRG